MLSDASASQPLQLILLTLGRFQSYVDQIGTAAWSCTRKSASSPCSSSTNDWWPDWRLVICSAVCHWPAGCIYWCLGYCGCRDPLSPRSWSSFTSSCVHEASGSSSATHHKVCSSWVCWCAELLHFPTGPVLGTGQWLWLANASSWSAHYAPRHLPSGCCATTFGWYQYPKPTKLPWTGGPSSLMFSTLNVAVKEPGSTDHRLSDIFNQHWSSWWLNDFTPFHGITIPHRIHGAAIYGVPWIPSIYPSHVSIFLPAPAGSVMGTGMI